MTVTTLEELAEQIPAAVTKAQRVVLDAARAFANEAGISRARQAMHDAFDTLRAAQENLRAAQDEHKVAVEMFDRALLAAKNEVRFDRVAKEGNKTFWVTDDDEFENVELDDGTVERKPSGRKVRRQMPAEEAEQNVDAEARRLLVVEAQQVSEAEQELAAARDDVELAKRRLSVTQTDVQAAIAQLQLLALALPREER